MVSVGCSTLITACCVLRCVVFFFVVVCGWLFVCGLFVVSCVGVWCSVLVGYCSLFVVRCELCGLRCWLLVD